MGGAALAKSPHDSPPPAPVSDCPCGADKSPRMSMLLGGAVRGVEVAAGAGGGANLTPPGGGGRIPNPPPPPALGFGRPVPSWPSFFYN